MPDHVYGIIEVESSSMLKKLVIVLGLVALVCLRRPIR